MRNYQVKFINSFIERFNYLPSFRRKVISYVFIFLAVILTITGFMSGLSKFSPDSWAYYELSKTIFHADFYQFNTYRSYYTEFQSASFPFGYPILLAVGQLFLGQTPFTAVIINLLVALSTWLLFIRLMEKIRLSALAGLAIASSLILFSPYLAEVFSGRSIPVAILLFTIGITAFLSNRFIICGIFLGISTLIRFDHLAYALIFQLLVLSFYYKELKVSSLIGFGFFIGIAPWVVYSQLYFDKFWVSDNSWVALSALPAYVVDYPASAVVSAFENPGLWLERITGNIIPLLTSIAKSAVNFPLLPILVFISVLFFLDLKKNKSYMLIALSVFSLSVSFAPFLFTGYFDSRYFALAFVVLSSLLVFCVETTPITQVRHQLYQYSLTLAVLLATLFGGSYIAKVGEVWIKAYGKPDSTVKMLNQLENCHFSQPDLTFIFVGNSRLAARYGATTGNHAAFLPSNFTRMSEVDKEIYFEQMKPFLLIDDSFKPELCALLK